MARSRPPNEPQRFVDAIARSGLTIYDAIEVGDPNLWIPAPQLEAIMDARLRGVSLKGLPLRTRSKVAKELVCKALGYPVPPAFKKTQPRFPGQQLDTYVQKSNNLQVWNEDLALERRYVIIRVDDEDRIVRVKVVTGETLAELETTGTLTQKYQARCVPGAETTELVSPLDTARLQPLVSSSVVLARFATPVDAPAAGELLPIATVFERLAPLLGARLAGASIDQERNRGAALHRLICKTLGYATYQDDGRFPDVRHQLLEVKLQTSPTIDLGLVRPDSTEPLRVAHLEGQAIRHCDVRYAIFRAEVQRGEVCLTHLYLITGEVFFSRFPQFQGKVLNKKLQIPLPASFFSD